MTKSETYLQLWAEALRRPSQYRTGIERRMRRLWNTMTPAEREQVA